MPGLARPLALLVASSLRLAHQLAEERGWPQIALDRYDGPDGHDVQAVADGSYGFLGRPLGTRVYLHHSWSRRDDRHDIDRHMREAQMVRLELPAPPARAPAG